MAEQIGSKLTHALERSEWPQNSIPSQQNMKPFFSAKPSHTKSRKISSVDEINSVLRVFKFGVVLKVLRVLHVLKLISVLKPN